MTPEDFRREIGDAFDSISGSPSPALSDRVRAALVQAPERRGPVWIAALAAAVIAVILVGVLLVANPLNRSSLAPGGIGKTTPSPTPCSVSCSPPLPSPSPTPSPAPSPGFTCAASPLITINNPPPTAFIDAIRAGTHTGYDRLTIEFKNGQPLSIELRPQTGTTFTRDAIGDHVTLAGKNGILVIIRGADAHTSYSGSTDLKTNYAGLKEARQVGDFEGTVHWALGLASSSCYHAYILDNPTRLVIDLPSS
jgi:hypothetical protein